MTDSPFGVDVIANDNVPDGELYFLSERRCFASRFTIAKFKYSLIAEFLDAFIPTLRQWFDVTADEWAGGFLL